MPIRSRRQPENNWIGIENANAIECQGEPLTLDSCGGCEKQVRRNLLISGERDMRWVCQRPDRGSRLKPGGLVDQLPKWQRVGRRAYRDAEHGQSDSKKSRRLWRCHVP